MALKRFTPEPLIFPMPNGTDYEVPPVDIDRGWRLSELLSQSPEDVDKTGLHDEDMFKLALTDELWDRMKAEGVPLNFAWRAGMAALAHYQVLDSGAGSLSDVHAAAMTAAEAIWESGVHPEAVAAWAAANLTTTSPATDAASAETASTSGTSSPKKTARPSRSTTSSSRKNSSSRTSSRSTASRSNAAI
ncbi:hypothetical protein GCM10009740_31400 [Terrabacter terrae]|uniref:DUF7426 domain-containing protein n=1 Tax=Terrabacter terrae TaxID=318434 RepID=A0ABN2UHR8_9MICO